MSEESVREQEKVEFHFIKGQGYRVLHVDGAHGGVTPRGNIFMAVYSERRPIPQVTVHPVSSEGKVGEEIAAERRTKEGIVREVEAGLLLDLGVAISLRDWLGKRIEELAAAMKEREERVQQESEKRA